MAELCDEITTAAKLPPGQSIADLRLELNTRNSYGDIEAFIQLSSPETDAEASTRIARTKQSQLDAIKREQDELARLIKKHGLPKQ